MASIHAIRARDVDPRRTCGATRRSSRLAAAGALLLVVAALPVPLAGQEAPVPDSVAALVPGGISPRGAFLRSAFVPGWGHAAVGSFDRGAFYVAAQGATAFTLVRSWKRLTDAEERLAFRERILRSDLAAEGITDLEEIQMRLDNDEILADLRGLEEARRQQREDWLALGIFLMLLSGADAYVSAHLAHFPAPLEIDARAGEGERMDLFVRIPLPS
jgi:hypothetical protein